jgi:hypothetical protein
MLTILQFIAVLSGTLFTSGYLHKSCSTLHARDMNSGIGNLYLVSAAPRLDAGNFLDAIADFPTSKNIRRLICSVILLTRTARFVFSQRCW